MLFAFVHTNAQTAQNYFNTGLDWFKKKQYEQAIQSLDNAIQLKPDYMFAYQVRGNSYAALKQMKNAYSDYTTALKLAPNNAINYYNRGNVYRLTRCYDSAFLDYNRSIQLKPDYTNAFQNRGITYANEKNYDLAIQDFSRAIAIDSNYYLAYNSRGLVYLAIGQYELSVNDFKKAIALDTNKERPFVVINIVEPLAHLYRFSEAAKYYSDFRSEYGTGYIDAPYWDYFKKYMEAVTSNLAKNDYAGALASLNEAEKLYDTKSQTNPNDDDASASFGAGQNLYGTKPKVSTGDDNAKRGYSSILALKGYVYEKLNNTDDAKKAYEEALLINNQQPDVTSALNRLMQKEQASVATDSKPPVINILEPAADKRSISVDNDKVAGATQRIRGQAVDESGIKSIMLNNAPLKVQDNGYFDTTVNIVSGVNVFTVVATDKHANSASQNIQIVTGMNKTAAATSTAADTTINSNPVYNAILIAESDYADKNIPTLEGPTSDMNKIYNLLTSSYSFDLQNTDTLINATRTSILETIIKKANAMSENDNLLVFYAGHGQMITQPDGTEEGFLVPQDAVKDMLSTYISSDDLLRTIKYSKAKHILFVADACFAGSLFRDIPSDAPVPVSEAYKDKSRRLLASGNRTTVPDKSEFIEDLRLALQENHQHYITAEQLIDTFKNQYTTSTHLTLQYFPIKDVDDLGGQFVFIRK